MKMILTWPGDDDFHLFEKLPNDLYSKEELAWKSSESVPERDLVICVVSTYRGEPKARLAVYINPELSYEGKKTASIGNYEAEDGFCSDEILEYTENLCKEHGVEFLIGPMNGSTWENYRFSLHNKHANFFLEPYHHVYYNDHFTDNGFESIAEYHSLLDREVVYKIPGAKEKEIHFRNVGVQFKNANLDEFETILADIHALNAIAYTSNFLYTPIEKDEFIEKYVKSKPFIDPEFLLLAYAPDDQLIGYYFCTPDVYNTKEKSLIIKSIARHPDEQYRGLGHAIGYQIYERAQEQGFVSVIHAFMHDDGTSAPLSKQFSENNFKKYRLYGKAI